MNSLPIALVAFASIFGGALLGLFIQSLLPGHHLSSESKDSVKLGAGLIATMAALVLGLLVSSAKGAFDTVNAGLVQTSAKVIMLDRLLAQYGPETKELRADLQGSVANIIDHLWPEQKSEATGIKSIESSRKGEEMAEQLRQLTPRTETQRAILAQAQQLSGDIALSRWTLIQQHHTTLPAILLVILIFWLSMLNITYGLFAPRNLTVITVLFVCALSVSASLLLIVEMSSPLDGMIKVSSAPLLNALNHLGK